MESRYFESEDYPMICQWWDDWNFQKMPEQALSKRGFIVSQGGEDICAAWLYSSDSVICWVEFYVANKKASRKNKKGAFAFLIEAIAKDARKLGFSIMFSSVKNISLMNRLEKSGFQVADEGMTNLIKVL